MLDLSLQAVLLRLVALLVLTGLHGFILALVARLLGAKGPGYDGRQTLNPFTHLDMLAIIPFILFQAGWIRPVALEHDEVRGKRAGLVAVALLGLALTLAIVVLIWLTRPWLIAAIPDANLSAGLSTFIRTLLEMSVWFTIFNILPIPPLTGGLILQALAPAAHAVLLRYDLVVRLGLIAVIALASPVLRPLFDLLWRLVALGRR